LSATSAKGRVSRASPVHTEMRNCLKDRGRPFGFDDQEPIPSHRELCGQKPLCERCRNVATVIPTDGRGRRAQANRCRSVDFAPSPHPPDGETVAAYLVGCAEQRPDHDATFDLDRFAVALDYRIAGTSPQFNLSFDHLNEYRGMQALHLTIVHYPPEQTWT
jgi:hypothetical protein